MFSGAKNKYTDPMLAGIASLLVGLVAVLALSGAATPRVYAKDGSSVPANVPTAISTVQPLCTVSFSDVKASESPFYVYVRVLACRNIISGYGDGTFRPNANVTRGQLAKMVAASAGYKDSVPNNRWTFHDVEPGSTYWLYVERVALHGVTSGYACNASGPTERCDDANRRFFRPNEYVTRQQVAKMVSAALNLTSTRTQLPAAVPTATTLEYTFADVLPSNAFYPYVEALSKLGSISGYNCGGTNPDTGQAEPCDAQNRKYFRPASNMSRGQISKVLATTFFPEAVAAGH
ncbi:MAG: hypothetical protein QOH93_179 [Chloroflexia bacterium]|jgi:hypothetical protein|nr:hypothetical protein [Chloroflexia bacterium]